MKRIFTICLLLTLVFGANAQVRKTWNFMKGFSENTVALLAADAENWYGDTKKVYTMGIKQADNELTAMGEVIPETSGLLFGAAGKTHIGLCLTDGGTACKYEGAVLINGTKSGDYFKMPKVGPGSQVAISFYGTKVERGIQVEGGDFDQYVINVNNRLLNDSTQFANKDTTMAIIRISPEAPDSVQLTIKGSGNCEILSIVIDEGDPLEEGANIGYLYDSSYEGYSYDADLIPQLVPAEYTGIDVKDLTSATDVTQFYGYDVLMVSDAIAADHKFVPCIAKLLGYVPMINMNAKIYDTLGWGTTVAKEGGLPFILSQGQETSPLFSTLTIGYDDNSLYLTNGVAYGYTPTEGSAVANDSVLAYIDGIPAITRHGQYEHNDYFLIPVGIEGQAQMTEDFVNLLNNVVEVAKATKAEVTKAITPAFIFEYLDGQTMVTIKQTNKGAVVRYTLDGSQPDESSPVYTEPFAVTTAATIKAYATCEGYDDSEVAEAEVVIYSQLQAPTISYEKQPGKTLVTIASNAEGASIRWNILGSEEESESALYTGVITVTAECDITAFATIENKLNSAATTLSIPVDYITVYTDTLAHMDSNLEEYGSIDIIARSSYYDTSNKLDSTYIETIKVWDEVLGDSVNKDIYSYEYAVKGTLQYYDFNNGWAVGSYGQWIKNQKKAITNEIDADTYGPVTPFDLGYTANCLSFYGAGTSYDPMTAWLQTTVKYQAPFDIVTYLSAESGLNEAVKIYVSADSITWTQIDSIGTTYNKQVTRCVTSYEGTDKVYVKMDCATVTDKPKNVKTLLFDVLLLKPTPYAEGIEEVIGETPATENCRVKGIYDLTGRRMHVENVNMLPAGFYIVDGKKVIVK